MFVSFPLVYIFFVRHSSVEWPYKFLEREIDFELLVDHQLYLTQENEYHFLRKFYIETLCKS